MVTTGNFLDIVILFGSIQGFISAFLLFRKKRIASNNLLGWILIITSLACLNIYLFQVLPAEVPLWLSALEKAIPLIIIMPLGPLIYFYVRSLYGSAFDFKKERLHFLPVALDIIPSVISIFGIASFLIGITDSIQSAHLGNLLESYHKYVDIPRWLSTTVYLVATVQFLRVQKMHGKTRSWSKQFLTVFGVFQFLWLLHLIPYIIPLTSSWLLSTLSWYPIYVPLTVLVYWLGVSAIIQTKSARHASSHNSNEMGDIVDRLDRAMKLEKLFLEPTLSLSSLVATTGIDQKSISSALNQYLGKSFNEYINEFRVEEVKRKLTDSSYDHLSITGMALESGFNSQATFQRAFKAVTKTTPKAYQGALDRETKSTQI